jgi:hypothetical protein
MFGCIMVWWSVRHEGDTDLRCIDVARTACTFHLCELWQLWRQRHTACAVGTTLKSVVFHAENKRADFTVPSPACC